MACQLSTIFIYLCIVATAKVRAKIEAQRYDGWYNNLANPDWGAKGTGIFYDVRPAYSDLTYLPSGRDRPNPRTISNNVLSGPSGLPSFVNRTALFAFFGEMVSYEVVHASDSSCPIELLKIRVPEGDSQFSNITGNPRSPAYMPFTRSAYNPETGQAPNRPRIPVNKVSSWIDGSYIYGRGTVWCNCLRSFTGGQLATLNSGDGFPGLNKIRLPMDNFPDPITQKLFNPETKWMFGDSHVHQNPGLMAIALVWFRYHNYLAQRIQADNPTWSDDEVFERTRRRVIAALQSVFVYEWLPALIGEPEPLPKYSGYRKSINPTISVTFEAAAFRLGHSQIPPGLYLRDKSCVFRNTSIRLCNSYWRSQDIILQHGLEEILLGMSSQIAEREDHIIVDDLRGNNFGPLHYTRHDLAVLTIMRGRDHGLPDYNKARRELGLQPVTEWRDINPWLYDKDPTPIFRLQETYKSLDTVDVYPAGLLEFTEKGPGPLFKTVIVDQFRRIRDGDRYWFENTQNGLFTEEEIAEIRNTSFRDIILAVTDISPSDVQENVFFWNEGDPCPQPKQLTEEGFEPCTPHRGYDYFASSEVSYIISFTTVCALPFACVLAAYLWHQWRKKKYAHLYRQFSLKRQSAFHEDGHYLVHECVGRDHWICDWLYLDECKGAVLVKSGRRVVRTIDLLKHDNIFISTSIDKKRDLFLLHVPYEYDLIVHFYGEEERREFVNKLRTFLRSHNKHMYNDEKTYNEMLARAITKEKRDELLTKFFKGVVAEAYSVSDYQHPDDIELNQSKEVIECQLSQEEFAEALALKPDSMFVHQMFSMIDKDNDGYISFRELMTAVLLFAQGSGEDKLRLVFAMYDKDNNGLLDRHEVTELIRSMIEMANSDLSRDETMGLVEYMFHEAGLNKNSSITPEDFAKVFKDQMDMFRDVHLDFKGKRAIMPKKKDKKKRVSVPVKRKEAKPSTSRSKVPSFQDATMPNELPGNQLVKHLHTARQFVENYRQHIVYLFIFYAICIMCFFERYYKFSVEKEHMGLRSLTGYGLSVTRGAAAAMSFTFSLLLLTMCRNIITVLRETVLNHFIPFDDHVAFHKHIAYVALFFTVIHVIGYCFNFYHVVTQPVPYLCVMDEFFFRTDILPDLNYWLYRTLVGFTGILLCIIVCIIYTFANQLARRHIFNAFWITHQLFYIFYVLILLHGATRLVQTPYFPYYFAGPAILFVIDKMVSISQNKKEIQIIKSELLPSDVTMLEFKRPPDLEYRSGQWIRLACDQLGSHEYHAFTLTSAPHEPHLSVHIRGVGPWTKNIRKIFDPEELNDKPNPKLYVDGPFGAGQQDWFRYEVSVLVGAGIGIAPYASILKDFVFLTSSKKTFRLKCRKLYFIWVTGSQKHFEWFIDILRQVEDVDRSSVVEAHIFITQIFQSFDLRTTMLYIFEEHFQHMCGRSLFTGVRAQTHFGRPDFDKILDAIHARHPKVKKVGVFSCGPPGITKGVEQACYTSSKRRKARFEHHFENF